MGVELTKAFVVLSFTGKRDQGSHKVENCITRLGSRRTFLSVIQALS